MDGVGLYAWRGIDWGCDVMGVIVCPDCDGEGRVEYERPRPHGFHRDIGYIDTVMDDCETCSGYGELESDDE